MENWTIFDHVQTILIDVGLLLFLFAEAINYIVYMKNCHSMLGIYASYTFPYQIRILSFLFRFFLFYKFLPLQIYHTSCLELVQYSTLCNIRFPPWVILSHQNEGSAEFEPFP